MQEHVLTFKTKMKYYHDNPNLKDGGVFYTAPDAVIELESLLNYDSCFTGLECNKKTFITSEIIMPLDELEKINDPKLTEVYYNKIIDTIQAQMGRVDYENIILLLVDLEQTGTDVNGDAIVSVGAALIGNQQIATILDDDNWWYGENLGLCGTGQYAPEDAATQLDIRVTNNLLPTPPTGANWCFRNVATTYINPTQDPLTTNFDNYLDYKIFYATEAVTPITDTEKCLEMFEMNFYLNYYIDYAEDYEISANRDFCFCLISGNPYGNPYRIQHDYYIFVGERFIMWHR